MGTSCPICGKRWCYDGQVALWSWVLLTGPPASGPYLRDVRVSAWSLPEDGAVPSKEVEDGD